MQLDWRGKKFSPRASYFEAHMVQQAMDMIDVVFIAATCTFFVIAIAYAWGCNRL